MSSRDPISEPRPTADGCIRWIQEWAKPGLVGFRIGRAGDDLVAEWIGLGTLRAARSGRSHVFTPCANAETGSTEGVRRTLVEGLLRHLQGKTSLHASAAALGEVAVVILGDSMAGKSTVVAELCKREGFEMLADDTVFLDERSDGFCILPTESTHSLREDAARLFGATTGDFDKAYLPAAAFASSPAKLCAFVRLAFDESVVGTMVRAMHGPEIFEALYSAHFRFVIDENDVILRDFSRMAALGAAVPFFELRRAHSLDVLRESVKMISALVPRGASEDA